MEGGLARVRGIGDNAPTFIFELSVRNQLSSILPASEMRFDRMASEREQLFIIGTLAPICGVSSGWRR